MSSTAGAAPVPHPRRFRFGVEMMRPFDGMSWTDSARRVEDLGFSTLFVPDHFHNGLGPITAMATKFRLPRNIIAGWMMPDTNCAPKLAS